MRVYISGPMSGLEGLNESTFRAAEELLKAAGHETIVPHDLTDPSWTYEQCMRRDLEELMRCDAIFMLPGWAASRGASVEFQVAGVLGLVCWDHRGMAILARGASLVGGAS